MYYICIVGLQSMYVCNAGLQSTYSAYLMSINPGFSQKNDIPSEMVSTVALSDLFLSLTISEPRPGPTNYVRYLPPSVLQASLDPVSVR